MEGEPACLGDFPRLDGHSWVRKIEAVTPGSRRRLPHQRETRSTSTIASDGALVPWLAAEGPLAYRPEQPPERDYYFQYGWVLPEIFAEGVPKRRRRYFGASSQDEASELFSFWASARRGELDPVFRVFGSVGGEVVAAPMAVYRTGVRWREPTYVMIQHGSYQLVRQADQPFVTSGELLLYRGVQRSAEFRWLEHVDFDPHRASDLARVRGNTRRYPFGRRPLLQLDPRSNQPL